MRYTTFAIIVCLSAVMPITQVQGEPWDTTVFEDDFSTSAPNGRPDEQKWIVNVPEEWWWTQGRTFFPSPTYHPAATFPQVVDGSVLIEHHSYNPYDLALEPWTFLGGQIRTILPFLATQAYRFEALVRNETYPSGLVTSFFTYGDDGSDNDEIDFEFVSKKNSENPDPTGDWILTNTWNDSMQSPAWVFVPGLNLAKWNLFRIYWIPGQRVDWTWLPNPKDEASEVHLRTETDAFFIPDEPMGVYSNVWAADATWPDAYDANLKVRDEPGLNEVLTFGIDDVRVSIPEPATLGLLGLGGLALLLRRKRRR